MAEKDCAEIGLAEKSGSTAWEESKETKNRIEEIDMGIFNKFLRRNNNTLEQNIGFCNAAAVITCFMSLHFC
ncbi:hypothetical protein [Agathobaculum sp.]|uniref:hypothetical protein n=1 Tax=Agathobaculum sp. TaxID=2048138 RepID=UPI003FA4C4A3